MFGCVYTINAEPMYGTLRYRDDYIGERFGNLVVIGYPRRNGRRAAGAMCMCDCGNIERIHGIGELVKGKKVHCRKCSKKSMSEAVKRRWAENPWPIKRGPYYTCSKERLFVVWSGMKKRCGSDSAYRDVHVCDEWQDYFAFREWAYSHGYDDQAPRGECTIDRINPFGDYEPANCRFVDMKTQANNTRRKWLQMSDEDRDAALAAAYAT